MKRILLAVLVAAAFFAWLPGADADVEGDCRLFVEDREVSDRSDEPRNAIDVEHGQDIVYRIESAEPVFRYTVKVFVLDIPVESRERTSPVGKHVLEDTLRLSDREKYGTGLYRLEGRGYGEDDEQICSGSLWLNVEGSIVETPAGIAGLAATVVGLSGSLWLLIAAIMQAVDVANEVREFTKEEEMHRRALREFQRKGGGAGS